MTNDKIKSWLYLTTKMEIPRTKLFRLYKYFKSGEAICNATGVRLRESQILSEDEISLILNGSYDGLDELMETLGINSVKVLTIESREYPEMLLELPNPPLVLYCRGKFIDLNKYVCIASVGTRTPTSYGHKCTYEIVKNLCRAGFVIVSGMAQGIDAISHMAAIDSGFPTVAFVANGVDVIYPKINRALHTEILKTGMIVSEYPLGTLPRKYHFLERNRLIAGVSKGLFLGEAGLKSGSSVTVSYALEQGKDVFALPGNVTSPMSAEPNRLIKSGAYPVTEAADIINHYTELYNLNMDYAKCLQTEEPLQSSEQNVVISDDPGNVPKIPDGLSPEEKVMFVLKESPCDIDTVSALTDISIADLNMMLLIMEMDGKIKSNNGNYYPID